VQLYTSPLLSLYNRLALIIDEDKEETTKDKSIKALTCALDLLIREQSCIILVSGNTLHNYAMRRNHTEDLKHPENIDLRQSPLYPNLWRIFKIHGACYYLLIPQKYLTLKNTCLSTYSQELNQKIGIKFNDMSEISYLLPASKGAYLLLQKFIEKDLESPQLCKLNLHNIFIFSSPTDKSRVAGNNAWLLYIIGHGSLRGHVAGTQSKNLLEILDFFDTQLLTKLVYICSCYAGGRNKQLLLRANKIPYHYPLIIGAATDAPATLTLSSMSFELFFKQAESNNRSINFTQGISLATQHLSPFESSENSRHDMSALPHLLPAGKQAFKSLDLQNATFSLNTPDEEVFESRDKAAILLYKKKYTTTLRISPAKKIIKTYPTDNTLLAEKFLTPVLFESIGWLRLKLDKLTSLEPIRELVAPLAKKKMAPDKMQQYVIKHFVPHNALFPTFISMLHPDPALTRFARPTSACHYFSEIIVDNTIDSTESPFFGLLRFIYDAFLDINERDSENIILIDTLTGYNDFALFFELYANATGKPDSERKNFFNQWVNETITLSKVLIKTKSGFEKECRLGDEPSYFETITIGFDFKGQSWGFSFKGKPNSATPWPFKKINSRTHASFYNRWLESIAC
jgi:hypothetical protein